MPRKPPKTGPYLAAGAVIDAFIKNSDGKWTREKIADRIGASHRTVTHWVNGQSWPREPEFRNALRGLGINVLALERAVCDVLQLAPYAPEDVVRLEAFHAGDETLKADVDAAISRFRERQRKKVRAK